MLERTLLAVLALVLLTSCSGQDKPGPVEPVEPKETVTFTLTVRFGEGVSGTPGEGVHTYSQGQSVEYSFKAAEGFHNAFAVLDSTGTTLTGALVMNSSKELYVSAEKIPYVPPEDAAVLQAAEKVLTEADKESAFRSYLEEEEALYAKYSPEEARARAQAVSMKAFAGADFTAIAALQEELAGKVFPLALTRTSASPARYLGSIQADPVEPAVDFLYVNGMFTARSEASAGGMEIGQMLEGAGLPFPVQVDLVYNSSAFRSVGKTGYCLLSFGLSCLAGGTLDWGETISQFMHAVSETPEGGTPEAQALALEFKRRRELGKPVLVITHSQGALIAREALEIRGSKDPCVAVVTLASPIGYFNWQVEDGLLSGFVIEGKRVGDIILRTGQNNFTRLTSDLSDQADKLVEESPRSVPLRIDLELGLHALTGSYLLQSNPRSAIKTKLRETALALAGKEECFKKKTSASILAVSGAYNNSHTSELWRVPPYEAGVDTLLGQVRLKDGRKVELTDVARHPDGSLWGTSFYLLYKIDEASLVAEPQADWNGIHPNGLEFSPDGLLYVSTDDGILALLDLDKLQYVWVSSFGKGYRSGGDIARCQDDKIFAIAEDGSNRNWLVEVSREDGAVRRIGDTAMEAYNIFGLACSGTRMFGLTSGVIAGKSTLVEIDMTTGKDRFIRALTFDAYGAAGDRIPRNRDNQKFP